MIDNKTPIKLVVCNEPQNCGTIRELETDLKEAQRRLKELEKKLDEPLCENCTTQRRLDILGQQLEDAHQVIIAGQHVFLTYLQRAKNKQGPLWDTLLEQDKITTEYINKHLVPSDTSLQKWKAAEGRASG
jgi:molybdopterin converting factor small subunit